MKIKYTLGQRCMAYILLVSFFLQSCYNPYNPINPRSVAVEQQTRTLRIDPLQEEPDKQIIALRHADDPIAQLVSSNPTGEVQVTQSGPIKPEISTLPTQSSSNLQQLNHKATSPNQQKAGKGVVKKRTTWLQEQNRLHKSQQAAQNSRRKSTSAQMLAAANQTIEPLVPNRQAIIPIATSTRETNQEALTQTYLAKGGHKVMFQQLPLGQWEAVVDECLPAGMTRRLLLPVYLEPGQSIATLSEKSLTWHKHHIHVMLDKQKSYVFIGSIGLLGGMYQQPSKEEKGKSVYHLGDKEVEIMETPASPILPPSSTEFTSEKDVTYQVLKNISMEVSQKVEEQTGLVIPFEPGKTTTEFVGGKGNFGELRLGKDMSSGAYVGIKSIRVNTHDPEEMKKVEDEAFLQSKLNGLPHLMPLLDVAKKENIIYQVMPLASLGNGAQLSSYLQTIQDPSFKEALLVHVAKSILQGFVGMHSLSGPIAHLDFKPDNLVIDKEGKVYIIDFGCSALLDEKGYLQGTGSGDKRYFSPERNACMAKKAKGFNAKAGDNWAIGLTLLELAKGLIEDKEDLEDGYFLTHSALKDAAPGSYEAMVQGFLQPDPNKRLTAQEALDMPLFQEETRPEVLAFLKEFVQTMQWKKKSKGLTSAQQLPLPHFTGYAARPDLEQAVTRQLLEAKAPLVACVGMGGVGKTQLLTYLVHSQALQKEYEHIYWFQTADNESSLLQQYHGLAQELKLVDEKTSVEKSKATLLSFLADNNAPTLLIFDNADDPGLLKSFLPQQGCQALVSSRSHKWENQVKVEVFTAEQVAELLTKLLPDRNTTLDQAKLLGETLGYLPLALNQAIAFIRKEEMSIRAYVTTYQEKKEKLLGANTQLYGKSLPHSMATLYQMQLEKLGKKCPEAITLLEYTALLAPDNIPLDLLSQGLLQADAPGEVYQKAQQALLAYALWQEGKGASMVRMHRLMQEVVRLPLTEEKLRERFRKLAARLEEYHEKVTVLADEGCSKAIVPHLEALDALAEKDPTLSEEVSSGNLLYAMGRYYVKPQLVMQEEGPQEEGGSQKKAIDLENIFDKLDERHPAAGKVLLLGGAGAGKSTMLSHLYEQWSAGKIWKEKYAHVFRVSLKELLSPDWLGKYTQAEQDLACFIHNSLKGQKIDRYVQRNKKIQEITYTLKNIQQLLQDPSEQKKVLLLVDGYDEISGIQGSDNYKKILETGVFMHSHVVMTSRPNAVTEIQTKFERQIEIQGLNEAGINEYINLQFKETHKKELGQELQAFLQSNSQVGDMCEVPINIALLCIIWKDPDIRAKLLKGMKGKEVGEFQLGQLYQELMIWLGKRYANKTNSGHSITKTLPAVSDESVREDQVYKALERVAYETFTGQGLETGQKEGGLRITGKLLEEMARKQDKQLKLNDLIAYGLLRGEGDPSKPLEQVYEFIHLSFQEYLTAYRLKELLSEQESLQEAATWIGWHRNEPKYLTTLKFLAGLVSQSENSKLVQHFWEAVACNVEDMIELGVESKVTLFMHLLMQSKVKGKVDIRIPNLEKIQLLVDDLVLEDISKWQQEIIGSGYLSIRLIDRVNKIMREAHVIKDTKLIKSAIEIVVNMANKGVFGSKEGIFNKLMEFVHIKDWQLQKLGLEKAARIIDKTTLETSLERPVKVLGTLLLDKNLEHAAVDMLNKIAYVAPQVVVENIKILLADKEPNVRSSVVYSLGRIAKALPTKVVLEAIKPLLEDVVDWQVRSSATEALQEIVKALPKEAEEAFAAVKVLLADQNPYVRNSAVKALKEIVKVLSPELAKEALSSIKPLLTDLKSEAKNDDVLDVLREIMKVLSQEAAEAFMAIKTLLQDEKYYIRDNGAWAVMEIVKIKPLAGILEIVNPMLTSKGPTFRSSAAQALGKIVKVLPEKAAEAFIAIKPLLQDENQFVRKTTADAVREIIMVKALPKEAIEEAFVAIKPLLADREPIVRSNAAMALNEIVKELPQGLAKEVFVAIKPLLQDGNPYVRSSTAIALKEIIKKLQGLAKEAFVAIKPLLQDGNPHVRSRAVEALKEIAKALPSTEALKEVKLLIQDKNYHVRIGAEEALKEIVKNMHPSKAFVDIKRMLADRDSYIKSSAVEALKEIVKALRPELVGEAFVAVKPLFADRNPQVKTRAVEALNEIVKALPTKAAEIFGIVKDMLKDPNDIVRASAVEVLSGIPKVSPDLVQETFAAIKPIFEDKKESPQKNAVKAQSSIIKASPELAKEAFMLIKTLLVDDNSLVREDAVKVLPAIVQEFSFTEVVNLLTESIPEIRSSTKQVLIEKFKLGRETLNINYTNIVSLAKLIAENKDVDETEKALKIGASNVLQQIAVSIDNDDIKWLTEHFDELPNLPQIQAFLKAVVHKTLSDGILDNQEAQLLTKCIVEKGITATFNLQGNQITLENMAYSLQNVSRHNLQQVVSSVIQLSQDPLAQQYRERKPLFINSGSALPIAQIDLKQDGSIGDIIDIHHINKEKLVSDYLPLPGLLRKETQQKPFLPGQKNEPAASMEEKSLLPSLAWNASTIATYLWKAPETVISEGMVGKIKLASEYLAKIGYQIEGVKADGNCFFNAFLGSYHSLSLSRQIPLLDMETNKISYLRAAVASYYKDNRAAAIRKDGEWVTSEEGGSLAKFLDIPIRVVTINQDQEGAGVSDMLFFAATGKDNQEWEAIPEAEKPKEYICIVDVGHHFLWAKHTRKNL